ncbi:ABC transporter permease [Rhodovastum atsumiense]|uniref:ABC transporter permease n=1 Tax=Rhodovastum atsumiense TaxID=504468 RepID=A0A5M6IV04_9PROT|nr:ABC transporter permease [Rhodovastum atsumiense]KAA5612140.1 ABC transporter permease [Rhodovastum atsumiense]CAH2603917.1 ABC transporter permease [Rhodovastum atsumiense]
MSGIAIGLGGWRRLKATGWPRPSVVLALLVVGLAGAWALAPGLFTAQDPLRGQPLAALQPPSAAHWFGTDHLGRDLYARTVHAAAVSLRATALAVAVALLGGGAVGLAAGVLGRGSDAALMRLVDVLMAIPSLLLAMAIVTVLGFGTTNVAIAVGVSAAATFARLTRGEVLRCRSAAFVEAATAAGVSGLGVVLRHILPHAAGPVLALATLEFGSAVLAVAALSFLGFGTSPPNPEWGLLIAEGRNFLGTAWWYSTLPGLVVMAVVLAANHLAGWMQDRDEAGP